MAGTAKRYKKKLYIEFLCKQFLTIFIKIKTQKLSFFVKKIKL